MQDQLKDKNIIVTGANCGIGYEAALQFARMGARVILACRDENKARNACKQIIDESKNENVEVELLDLGKMKSIKDFSDRIKAKLNKLDILLNNAGILVGTYQKTEDGFENTFAVNHLGPYYLTRLLIDLIKKSAPSRIVNVSSVGHMNMKVNWDDLGFEQSYFSWKSYRHSKLCNILFTIELAEQLKNTGVTTVSLHPGVIKTELYRSNPNNSCCTRFINGMARPLISCFFKTVQQGAQTSIYCCTAEDVVNHPGAYYADSKIARATSEATNMESAKRLWKISSEMVKMDEKL